MLLYRLLADAEFFQSRIGKIDGAGDLGQQLVNIVNGKPVLASNKATKTEVAMPEASHKSQTTEPPISQPLAADTATDGKEESNETEGQEAESKPSVSDEKTS